jgi:hypothetical protein
MSVLKGSIYHGYKNNKGVVVKCYGLEEETPHDRQILSKTAPRKRLNGSKAE